MNSISTLTTTGRILFITCIAFTLLVYLWSLHYNDLYKKNSELLSQLNKIPKDAPVSDTVYVHDTIFVPDTIWRVKTRNIRVTDESCETERIALLAENVYLRGTVDAREAKIKDLEVENAELIDSLDYYKFLYLQCLNQPLGGGTVEPPDGCLRDYLYSTVKNKRRFLWNKAKRECKKKRGAA